MSFDFVLFFSYFNSTFLLVVPLIFVIYWQFPCVDDMVAYVDTLYTHFPPFRYYVHTVMWISDKVTPAAAAKAAEPDLEAAAAQSETEEASQNIALIVS
jgi:hypothetical protein